MPKGNAILTHPATRKGKKETPEKALDRLWSNNSCWFPLHARTGRFGITSHKALLRLTNAAIDAGISLLHLWDENKPYLSKAFPGDKPHFHIDTCDKITAAIQHARVQRDLAVATTPPTAKSIEEYVEAYLASLLSPRDESVPGSEAMSNNEELSHRQPSTSTAGSPGIVIQVPKANREIKPSSAGEDPDSLIHKRRASLIDLTGSPDLEETPTKRKRRTVSLPSATKVHEQLTSDVMMADDVLDFVLQLIQGPHKADSVTLCNSLWFKSKSRPTQPPSRPRYLSVGCTIFFPFSHHEDDEEPHWSLVKLDIKSDKVECTFYDSVRSSSRARLVEDEIRKCMKKWTPSQEVIFQCAVRYSVSVTTTLSMNGN